MGQCGTRGTDGPVVKLRLQGACGSCPSSTMTLRMALSADREMIPEIAEVEQITNVTQSRGAGVGRGARISTDIRNESPVLDMEKTEKLCRDACVVAQKVLFQAPT